MQRSVGLTERDIAVRPIVALMLTASPPLSAVIERDVGTDCQHAQRTFALRRRLEN